MKSIAGTKGFTLIEILAVLLILAILAAVVAVRVTDTGLADRISQAETLKAHLRYAQLRALNTDTAWGIHFASATTYYLFQGAGSTAPVLIPGEENATVSLTAKNSKLTITPPAGGRISFDTFGSPGPADITLATSGGSIVITGNTGFIP